MNRTPEEIKKGLECRKRGYAEKCDRLCSKCMFYVPLLSIAELYADALAYIQQLEAQVPKWISVEERLPENDDDVLIITEFGTSMGYYDIYRDYWLDYVNSESNIVTHWMPLPEGPKEG